MAHLVVFTDLDGTLLERKTYSAAKSRKAINELKKMGIPLIFCSSKTKREIEIYRKRLGNRAPFIAEDGSAIYIPKNYFNFRFDYSRKDGKYKVIELGVPVHHILHFNRFLKMKGIDIIGFNDVTPEYIKAITNLPYSEAKLTKKRSYSEPLLLLDRKQEKRLRDLVSSHGLNVLKAGMFYIIVGKTSKGTAARKLLHLFRKKFGGVESIAFGNSENDFEMLKTADKGFLVQKPDRKYESPRFRKAKGIGPEGFSNIILEILAQSVNHK